MKPPTAPPDVPGARHRTVTIATADAGPLDLHVLEAGDAGAPPVLLLHGWPQHAWCWRHVIPLLAGDYRLIAPDLRGFGWSDCPAGGYDPVTFAADAVALLDALEIERADVIGHDWGGSAAFALALTAPERVRPHGHPEHDRALGGVLAAGWSPGPGAAGTRWSWRRGRPRRAPAAPDAGERRPP